MFSELEKSRLGRSQANQGGQAGVFCNSKVVSSFFGTDLLAVIPLDCSGVKRARSEMQSSEMKKARAS